MAASGAKYGIMTSHFYWVGAIPAMVFLGDLHDAVLLRLEGALGAGVSEDALRREDARVQCHLVRGDDGLFLRHLAATRWRKLLETLVHWNYWTCIFVSAFIVLVYIFLGGLTSAIYNEVLQFFMIVLGFAPLVFLGLKDVGGWTALKAKLRARWPRRSISPPDTWSHSWMHMGSADGEPDGHRLVRHGDGPRVRAFVRLLVHGLPGGAARDGGELDVRGAPHAADRRGAEDALSRRW